MEDRPFSDISFVQFLNEDRLMGSKCTKCGALYFPPRPICIHCAGTDMEWVEAAGKGKLKAFTCIAVGPPSMREEGYGRKRPYCTGVIELDEGPRVVARIEEVETNNPEAIKVGTPMTVKYLHRNEGGIDTTYLAFKPV